MYRILAITNVCGGEGEPLHVAVSSIARVADTARPHRRECRALVSEEGPVESVETSGEVKDKE